MCPVLQKSEIEMSLKLGYQSFFKKGIPERDLTPLRNNVCFSKEVLIKKELQLFNRVNIPIQNILIRACGGTPLIQSLLCYRVTFGKNSLRYITTSSKSLVKLLLNCLTLKGFIKRTAEFGHFSFEQMNRRIQNCSSVKDGMSEFGSFLDISRQKNR